MFLIRMKPDWLRVVEPTHVPSEWLTLDLGGGELAAMALALETPQRIFLLDDSLARRRLPTSRCGAR